SGDHNYADHWGEDVEERIDLLVAGAHGVLGDLPRRRTHEAILNGVLAYYLGRPGAAAERHPVAAEDAAVRALSTAIRLAA
ncbi:MAG: hypothetical protein JST59_06480, partial [Actinobacteria bacterium]|nr:hypothetical protein [Actinomycetota bacterium]